MTQPLSAAALLKLCPEFSAAMLSNVLSWMDLRDQVKRTRVGGRTLWELKAPPPKLVFPPLCPVCGGPWVSDPQGQTCLKCGRDALKFAVPVKEDS